MDPTDIPYYDLFLAAQGSYFIPWYYLAAQVWRESRFNPDAISPAGAMGLAQFMPETWEEWGEGHPFDPKAAIDAQARYMAYIRGVMLRWGYKDFKWALAGYNYGPWATQVCLKWENVPARVRQYVQDILDKAEEFKAMERKEHRHHERGAEVHIEPDKPADVAGEFRIVGSGNPADPGGR